MSSVEVEKRKREEDDGKPNGKRAPAAPLPPDEEVEEFFAIVKRIRVALKYFQRRDDDGDGDGVRCMDGVPTQKPTWSPSFEPEDFDGVKTDAGCSRGREKTGLDLNADPVSSD